MTMSERWRAWATQHGGGGNEARREGEDRWWWRRFGAHMNKRMAVLPASNGTPCRACGLRAPRVLCRVRLAGRALEAVGSSHLGGRVPGHSSRSA